MKPHARLWYKNNIIERRLKAEILGVMHIQACMKISSKCHKLPKDKSWSPSCVTYVLLVHSPAG